MPLKFADEMFRYFALKGDFEMALCTKRRSVSFGKPDSERPMSTMRINGKQFITGSTEIISK